MGQTFPKFQQFCIPSINPSNSISHEPKQILSKDYFEGLPLNDLNVCLNCITWGKDLLKHLISIRDRVLFLEWKVLIMLIWHSLEDLVGRSFRLFFHNWLARVVVVADEDLCSDLLKVCLRWENSDVHTFKLKLTRWCSVIF